MKTVARCAVFVVLFVAGATDKGQEHALENYWPVMGVEFSEAPVDFATLFGREAPVTLEIGFGMGRLSWRWRKHARSRISSALKCIRPASARVWHPLMKRALKTCASCATTR